MRVVVASSSVLLLQEETATSDGTGPFKLDLHYNLKKLLVDDWEFVFKR